MLLKRSVCFGQNYAAFTTPATCTLRRVSNVVKAEAATCCCDKTRTWVHCYASITCEPVGKKGSLLCFSHVRTSWKKGFIVMLQSRANQLKKRVHCHASITCESVGKKGSLLCFSHVRISWNKSQKQHTISLERSTKATEA